MSTNLENHLLLLNITLVGENHHLFYILYCSFLRTNHGHFCILRVLVSENQRALISLYALSVR